MNGGGYQHEEKRDGIDDSKAKGVKQITDCSQLVLLPWVELLLGLAA